MSVEYYCFVKAYCRLPHMVAAHVGEGLQLAFFLFFWGGFCLVCSLLRNVSSGTTSS
jgi:hypothetical protein